MEKALSGIKVIELATFVAAPSATKYLADQGADVIKIENLAGDGIRFAGESEGRPSFADDPYHNLTFDIENGNKRGMSLNLKQPECFEILMKLLEKADVFVTNWRPQALAKLKLDYESLKERFPKLVYASVTGYGDKGPDKDLPGYDFTAFWTRSGILGSLYEKGQSPMNLIPSMGDRASGMCLASGILTALIKAQRTGKGDKVNCSLLGTAVFLQGTMIQASQYGKISFPTNKSASMDPSQNCFKTKDNRWIQMSTPIYDLSIKPLANALNRPDWLSDERFMNTAGLKKDGNNKLMFEEICKEFNTRDAKEIMQSLKENDIPFALAQTWDEVLEDEQIWANDYFFKKEFKSGTVTEIRNPIQLEECGLPETKNAPLLGEHTAEVMKELGYSDEIIQKMMDDGLIKVTKA